MNQSEKTIKGYIREYELENGNLIRMALYALAIAIVVAGLALSFEESEYSLISREFSFALFVGYLFYAALIALIGKVAGYLVDVQTSKLELLEIQTAKLLEKKQS